MSYSTETVAEAINKINSRYYLPAIQREFVWDQDQIVRLFDSLMREYPIGSFLFWHIEDKNKDDFVKYKFIEDYTTNEKQTPHSARHRNKITKANGHSDIKLVLDGQQRLSSLYIGLKGSYTKKEKYKQYDNPDAWKQKRLYLNLLSNPDETTEGRMRLQYEFEFRETSGGDDGEEWYPVGKVLDIEDERDMNQKIESLINSREDLSNDQELNIRQNMSRLYRMIHKDQIVNYYTEQDQKPDKVLDIFIRTNDGGTQLTKSDLLLSLAVGNWDRTNAREEITNFVDRLNKQLEKNNNFDKDFVLKSCLVLSELEVRYRVENFTRENLSTIEKNWDDIKNAIEKAVKLINGFGIDSNNLTSQNAVIPIVYYFMQNPDKELMTDSREDSKTRKKIQKWFLTSLLNGTFGGQADTVLKDARKQIENDGDFPLDKINSQLRSRGKNVGFNDEIVENILEFEYGNRKTFLALTLLYEMNNWGHQQFHVDHIFPDSEFDRDRLRERGYSEDKIDGYLEAYNQLGNLELLNGSENNTKDAKEFREWIKTRDKNFKQKHLIPEDEKLYDFDHFLEFKERREELIKKRLNDLFNQE